MISSSYDIEEFVEAVRDREYAEVIFLADKEAVQAWRETYRRRRNAEGGIEEGTRYEKALKEFIRSLQSANGVPKRKAGFSAHLRSVLEELQDRRPGD